MELDNEPKNQWEMPYKIVLNNKIISISQQKISKQGWNQAQQIKNNYIWYGLGVKMQNAGPNRWTYPKNHWNIGISHR